MTRRGIGVTVLGALAVTVGALLGWIEVTAVGAALLVLVALTFGFRFPRSAQWHDVSVPARVVRGDEASITVGVTVPSGSTTWVSAVDHDGRHRGWLPDGERVADLSWPIDTSRRGVFPGGPSRLEAQDPFGIRRRTLAIRQPTPVLVVPRIHPVSTISVTQSGEGDESADQAGSDQFHSLREYVVGDPMKMVHWRSSARVGKLMVRRMVDTTVPWLLVVLDVNARAYDVAGALFADFDAAAFEDTVDTAASWAWWGCGPEQRVLLTTTADDAAIAEVTAGTRESALDWLAVIAATDPEHCTAARVDALSHRNGVGRIVLVTGRHTQTSALWQAQWQRSRPVSVVVGHA
jgi:uncharacterized protein (DUF58 family)